MMPRMVNMKTVCKGIGLLLVFSLLLTNTAGEMQAKGKGDQIKEVVASTGGGMESGSCIFVLTKDGSVWGDI